MSRRKNFKKRPQKDTLLLVCGGNTEKWYFENYNKTFVKTKIICKCKNSKTSPMKVVDFAIHQKNLIGDTILKTYAIFDKDDFEDFDSAIEKARKNDITPIFSNQSFELWLLQFFEITSNPLDRRKYENKLNRYFKKMYKDKPIVYAKKKDTINKIFEMCNCDVDKAINNCKINFQKKNKMHKECNKKFSELESISNVFELIEFLEKLS